ncbi:LysR family transcriptional regulator [Shewanella sp. SR44-3]|uniref:LysR family transcriptional regulator n=1 Tax=unclassified Shewanella TaxID=196818 RepID=UPI0015F83CBC|nr:LysR family transcriptional regulator [Shewanella sp. SR44-3]MBB1269709.1 LysR family transcriptional regulator [Shewanella sp. SR44-3]
MNVQGMRALVLTAELGSVSAAARRMGKRQSQVSQWLSNLELDLGLTLFERTQNQIKLNAAGVALLPSAIMALSQWDSFQGAAEVLALQGKSTLVIGVENYIPISCLNQAVVAFCQAFPKVNLEIVSDSRDALLIDFKDKYIDIVVVNEDLNLAQLQWGYCRVGNYQDVFVVNPEHPLAGQICDGRELAQYRELVWGRGEMKAGMLDVGFSSHYCISPDLSQLLTLLGQLPAYSLLPKVLVQHKLDSGELAILNLANELAPMARFTQMFWHHGFELSPLGKPLLAELKAALSQMT